MLSAPITATDTMTEEMHSNGQLTDSPHITATAPLTALSSSPGLNAAIRGVARAAYEMFDAEIVGVVDGYRGLIQGEYKEMKLELCKKMPLPLLAGTHFPL